MQQRPMEGGDGRLIAAARAGGGEHAADLVDEGAFRPERTRLVEEIAHLRTHIPEPRRRAEDDRVVIDEILRRGDRCRLIDLHPGILHYILRHQLRHAFHRNLNALDGAGTMSNGIGQGFHMAVRAVVKNEQFCVVSHGFLLPVARGISGRDALASRAV
jgi:hypothetical protein